ELAVAVGPPAVHGAGTEERTGVGAPGRNLPDEGDRDLYRNGRSVHRPISDIASDVVAPAEERPVATYGAHMSEADGKALDGRGALDAHWCGRALEAPIPKLALGTLSPALDRLHQRARGVPPCGDGHRPSHSMHRRWGRCLLQDAVAELTEAV